MEERAYYMKRVGFCNDLDHFFYFLLTSAPALLVILLDEVMRDPCYGCRPLVLYGLCCNTLNHLIVKLYRFSVIWKLQEVDDNRRIINALDVHTCQRAVAP